MQNIRSATITLVVGQNVTVKIYAGIEDLNQVIERIREKIYKSENKIRKRGVMVFPGLSISMFLWNGEIYLMGA